jgi:type I restriction enzyme S subunit
MTQSRYRCADLVDAGVLIIGDGYRAKNSELSAVGVPFARAGNIDGGFHFDDADCFPLGALVRVGDKVSRPGDVVFTSKGTVGRFAFVREGTPRFVYSPQLCFWRSNDATRLDPRFLYFWLTGPEFWAQASRVKGQTDMADYVSLRDQRAMSITLPNIDDQRAIARILGALDDKIALNRRMAETLESMARALFRSWFVEPDASGSQTVSRRSEWPVGTIADLADVVGGSTPSTKTSHYWDGGTHAWATPKDLAALASPVLLDTERHITDAGLATISSGLLEPGTVLLSSRAPIGYLAITELPVAINQGFIAMRPRPGVPNLFLLFWADASHDDIVSRANGSTFLEISKANFRTILVKIPPREALATFERAVRPLYERMVLCVRESATLATLRDTLLPKLLSGELRVPDAERLTAAHA